MNYHTLKFKETLNKSVRGEYSPFVPFDTPCCARHSGRTGNVSNHSFGLVQRFLKIICITLFLWIGFPLSASAAEAEAGAGASAPAAAGTTESAAAAANTGASAKTEAGTGESAKVEVGTRTAQWLDTQREGRTPGNLLPIPGAEAGLSYRRYINSFSKPIPDQLLLEAPVSSLSGKQ